LAHLGDGNQISGFDCFLPGGKNMNVYLEMGKKRVIACSVDWPGWYRMARDQASALQNLFDSAPRFARIVASADMNFSPPTTLADINVLERLEGNSTTEFGSPGVVPSVDLSPIPAKELDRFQILLMACWRAFDQAVVDAQGKELRKGPRGGGRDQQGILKHVLDSEASYVSRLGLKYPKYDDPTSLENLELSRRNILEALAAKSHLESPGVGPRGGALWMPRYFVRTVASHLIDHTWELEDRIL
jgi:hypothetical protein